MLPSVIKDYVLFPSILDRKQHISVSINQTVNITFIKIRIQGSVLLGKYIATGSYKLKRTSK